MKAKNIFITLFCVLGFAALSQTTQKREVANFDKIDASGAANVRYTASDSTSVKVTAKGDEMGLIETSVLDGVLYLKTKGSIRSPFKIEVTCPVVNFLTLSGASKFESKSEM